MFVPEVILHGRPDDFGDAGLFGEDEAIAVVGSFEGGEAERFGDGAHDENIGDRINIAELFATDETGEDDVL